jgi:hypothetical protein
MNETRKHTHTNNERDTCQPTLYASLSCSLSLCLSVSLSLSLSLSRTQEPAQKEAEGKIEIEVFRDSSVQRGLSLALSSREVNRMQQIPHLNLKT